MNKHTLATLRWLMIGLAFLTSKNTHAELTSFQVSQGAFIYNFKDIDTSDRTKNENIKPTLSLQVSGAVTPKSQNIWFDLFIQAAMKDHKEYKYSSNSEETNELSIRFIGAGLKLTTDPRKKMSAFLKSGLLKAKVTVTEEYQDESETSRGTYHTDLKGYYVGSGAGMRFSPRMGLSVDYAAIKLNLEKNLQHSAQVGLVFYF